jgi:hypothetical protein
LHVQDGVPFLSPIAKRKMVNTPPISSSLKREINVMIGKW